MVDDIFDNSRPRSRVEIRTGVGRRRRWTEEQKGRIVAERLAHQRRQPGGGLSNLEPHELAGTVMKEAVKRSGVDPKQVNYVTVGNCIPTDSHFAYVGRGDPGRTADGVGGDDRQSAVLVGAAGGGDDGAEHPARRLRLRAAASR